MCDLIPRAGEQALARGHWGGCKGESVVEQTVTVCGKQGSKGKATIVTHRYFPFLTVAN